MAADSKKSWTPQRLLQASVVVAILTIALKTGAWYFTGSVGLLADAMESFVNLASAMFRAGDGDDREPPGRRRPPLRPPQGRVLLVGLRRRAHRWCRGGDHLDGVPRLWAPQPLTQVGLGLALSVVSSAFNGLLAWVMFRSARQHRSIALEADAKHLVTDVWTSVGVVVGLVAVALTGWLWLDAVVAIGVALNIVREGVRLMWRSSQGLMDEAVEPEVMADIQEALDQFAHPTIRFDHVSTRRSGQRRFVDLHMHMPPSWSLGRAAALRTSVEQALMSAVPGLRATIQLLPSNVEAHSGDEKDLI